MRDLIRLESAGFRYRGSARPILRELHFKVREGDRILIRGPSGSGKSTLLQLLAGLVPDYVPGIVTGSLEFPYSVKGVVLQNPEAQVVTPTVEEEVAFALENAGMDRKSIRYRIEKTLQELGIAHLAGRHPLTLSGGECQRVSLAAALALEPEVLFLDEPTAYLDEGSSSSFFDALARLPGRTAIVVVEHRIRAAAAICSTSYEVTTEGRLVLSDFRTAPPLAGRAGTPIPPTPSTVPSELEICGLSHHFDGGGPPLFTGVSLSVRSGEVAALTGPSGCGKTTLLGRIARILPPGPGEVRFGGRDAATMKKGEFNSQFLYLPQNPEHMFVADTVRAELDLSGPSGLESAGRFGLGNRLASNPYRLSEGEKRRLNLCIAAADRRPVCLLDEPTYGLDDATRASLSEDLRALAAEGSAVLFVSHDEDFVRGTADTVYRMKAGAIVREEGAHAGTLRTA